MENRPHAAPGPKRPRRQRWYTLFRARGRIGRGQYLAVCGCALAAVLLSFLALGLVPWGRLPGGGGFRKVMLAAQAALLALAVAAWVPASIKRLHDLGRPRRHFFYLLLPFYVFLLLFQPGDGGRNRYGTPRRNKHLYWNAALTLLLPALLVLLAGQAHYQLRYALPYRLGATPPAQTGAAATPPAQAAAPGAYVDPDGYFLLTLPEGWGPKRSAGEPGVTRFVAGMDTFSALMVYHRPAAGAAGFDSLTEQALDSLMQGCRWDALLSRASWCETHLNEPDTSVATLGGRRFLQATAQGVGADRHIVARVCVGVYGGELYALVGLLGPEGSAPAMDEAFRSFAILK